MPAFDEFNTHASMPKYANRTTCTHLLKWIAAEESHNKQWQNVNLCAQISIKNNNVMISNGLHHLVFYGFQSKVHFIKHLSNNIKSQFFPCLCLN